MNNPVEEFKLELFIKGENIDLCVPNEEFAMNSRWHKWFNDPKTSRFLEQGIFPNTKQDQISFFNSLNDQNRLSLIISDRKHYIGTISLSSINLYKRTADIAMLIGEKSTCKNASLFAIEAMSLITAYGFNTIGLKRISAGQHVKLTKWQVKLELLGYRVDGIKTLGFIKGDEEADSVTISVVKNDFNKIVSKRGKLWDNDLAMKKRIDQMVDEPFVKKLSNFMKTVGEEYYNSVFRL
jgi:RimJ/RimL family protein N-acetyltransferase